ncbi:MAG: tRNA-intron lyase, partial [Archaeoglobaceae archaeon]
EKIYLHPIEALYLQLIGKANFGELKDVVEWVKKKVAKFPEIFFVYQDLRKKGKKVRVEDNFIFVKKLFLPISEKDAISFEEVKKLLSEFGEFMLAIVDEESEVTYYSVKKPVMQGEQIENLPKIHGSFFKDRVITKDVEIFRKYFYGNELDGFVVLSMLESVYLLEKGVLEVDKAEEMLEIAKNSEEFEERFKVYRDLKDRKFVVKTGFKFGSDFRVYRKVESLEQLPHSEFMISIVKDAISAKELSRTVRIANSVRKKAVFVWKGEYFLFEWVRI